jgi:hypothetical protein
MRIVDLCKERLLAKCEAIVFSPEVDFERCPQGTMDTKTCTVPVNTRIAISYKSNAEGGTRTRTAFWARGFSYHYSFRHLPIISSLTVCGLDDAFSVHVSLPASFDQANKRCLGGSRLVSTLC